jgi:hypothetical protein
LEVLTKWITLVETTWTAPEAFVVTWASIETGGLITVTEGATSGWIIRAGTFSQTYFVSLDTFYFTIIGFTFGITTVIE